MIGAWHGHMVLKNAPLPQHHQHQVACHHHSNEGPHNRDWDCVAGHFIQLNVLKRFNLVTGFANPTARPRPSKQLNTKSLSLSLNLDLLHLSMRLSFARWSYENRIRSNSNTCDTYSLTAIDPQEDNTSKLTELVCQGSGTTQLPSSAPVLMVLG